MTSGTFADVRSGVNQARPGCVPPHRRPTPPAADSISSGLRAEVACQQSLLLHSITLTAYHRAAEAMVAAGVAADRSVAVAVYLQSAVAVQRRPSELAIRGSSSPRAAWVRTSDTFGLPLRSTACSPRMVQIQVGLFARHPALHRLIRSKDLSP